MYTSICILQQQHHFSQRGIKGHSLSLLDKPLKRIRVRLPQAVQCQHHKCLSYRPQEFPPMQRSVQRITSPQSSASASGSMSRGSSPTTESVSSRSGSSPAISQVSMNRHHMTTRLKAGITKPNPRYALLSHKVVSPELRTLAEALKHPGWNNAMTEEITNCDVRKTWSLVPYAPGMHVLGNRWIHRTKYNADGSIKSLRSRLVAQRCGQEEGVDYLQTYSPGTATVRLVLHIATVFQWDIKQMDVANAFLHGDLTETVYMRQPAGFVDKTRPDHVCLLHKELYGLK